MKKHNKKTQEKSYHCAFIILLAATTLAVIFFTAEGRAYLLPVHMTAETRMISLDKRLGAWVHGGEQVFDGNTAEPQAMDSITADEEQAEKNASDTETQLTEQGSMEEASLQTETAADTGRKQDAEADAAQIGVTEYEYYEPQPTDSPYYSDAGRVALTTEYDYTIENTSYFNDAAFLGDSRTLGISDYAGLDDADFYCDNGVSVFKLFDDDITYQKTGEKVDIRQVLQEKQYGKIYIMLGMNDIGYGNTGTYLENYRKVVEQIREWQPGVIIYVMANLHVSREKNNPDTEFNNININDKNAAAAELADGKDIFYLDCNPLFTDEDGFLNGDLTFDGVHLYAQCYDEWKQFLLEHCVEPDR
jgi:hypothetical protein